MTTAELEQQLSWHWLLPVAANRNTQVLGFSDEEARVLLDALNHPAKEKITSKSLPSATVSATIPLDTQPNFSAGVAIFNVDSYNIDNSKAIIQNVSLVVLIGKQHNLANWYSMLHEHKNINEYGLLPTSQPRVVIPLSNHRWTHAALGLHRPGRWIARQAVGLARLIFRIGNFPRLFQRRLIIASRALTVNIPHGVSYTGIKLSNKEIPRDFALYLGTADANRKTVILPLSDDKLERIVKLAETEAAKVSLKREAEALNAIAMSTLAEQIPRLILFYENTRSIALHIEYRSRCKVSSSRMNLSMLEFMSSLANLDNDEITLTDWLERNPVKLIDFGDDERALYKTIRLYAERNAKLRTHRVHGDFAPWNCSWTSKGFFVFDWEESYSDGLAFSDACHYLLAPAILINTVRKPDTVIDRIFSSTEILAKRTGINPELISLHLAVWLLTWACGRKGTMLTHLRRRLIQKL